MFESKKHTKAELNVIRQTKLALVANLRLFCQLRGWDYTDVTAQVELYDTEDDHSWAFHLDLEEDENDADG